MKEYRVVVTNDAEEDLKRYINYLLYLILLNLIILRNCYIYRIICSTPHPSFALTCVLCLSAQMPPSPKGEGSYYNQ